MAKEEEEEQQPLLNAGSATAHLDGFFTVSIAAATRNIRRNVTLTPRRRLVITAFFR